jgi:hypothetical protein
MTWLRLLLVTLLTLPLAACELVGDIFQADRDCRLPGFQDQELNN